MIRPRVVLADDNEEILQAETALLQAHADVVGVARDGAALVAEVERLHPDLVILDITMPKIGGIDVVRQLIMSGSTVKFVFLTVHSEEEFVNACMGEGAHGYVWKSRMKAHLIPAVFSALGGGRYVSPLTSA